MLYFNVFLILTSLIDITIAKGNACATCVGNVVLPMTEELEADKVLQQAITGMLAVGSPLEYVLALHDRGLGLPDGAAKHLLRISDDT